MIELVGEPFRSCDGTTRRSLLKVGVLGLLGLGLPDLLRAKAAAGSRSNDDMSVILVWLDGGPPQHETYDPKPEAPSEFRGPLGAISTKVPGIQVSELLPYHARLMDKMAIIRSMHHDNGDHFAAAHWMLTGYHGSNAINQAPQYPSIASIVTRLKGPRRKGVPPYVGLPTTHSVGIAPGYHGAAYLGAAYDPFTADGDPNRDGYTVPNLSLPSGVNVDRLEHRRDLLGLFDQVRREADPQMETLDRFTQQAFDMVSGPAARAAFDLSREDPRLRDRYGRHQWGQSALLARRLIEAGARFVTLTFGGWDYHSSLEAGMHRVLPIIDNAIGSLVDDLDQRGMLDRTIVLVMGEFGRTPRLNNGLPNDKVPGRDHWGQVMSVLVAGGGFNVGRVIGASNARGERPSDYPVTPQDLAVTLYQRLGIDPLTTFADRVGRPITVGSNGQVIEGLI